MKVIVDSGLVLEGVISLICGGVGELFDYFDSQDVVIFIGLVVIG